MQLYPNTNCTSETQISVGAERIVNTLHFSFSTYTNWVIFQPINGSLKNFIHYYPHTNTLHTINPTSPTIDGHTVHGGRWPHPHRPSPHCTPLLACWTCVGHTPASVLPLPHLVQPPFSWLVAGSPASVRAEKDLYNSVNQCQLRAFLSLPTTRFWD